MSKKGKQSIDLERPVLVINEASIVGKREGEGPLGSYFDRVLVDEKCGEKNWEAAESTLQQETLSLLYEKAQVKMSDTGFLFAGDLLGQLMASAFGMKDTNIPFFGLYGACSTIGEGLALGAMTVAAGYGKQVAVVASSHFESAEKQFRFPMGYGNQRPLSATWTVTGSGAFLLGQAVESENHDRKEEILITGVTVGKIVDYGIKDSFNMGACMAPAAANVIVANLSDFERRTDYYDKIITGDLGYVGKDLLLELLREEQIDIENIYIDCGIEIFDQEKQDTHSGGSGCGCSASVLAGYVLGKLRRKEWRRVLFIPTGALLSGVSFNEGRTIPSIAYGIVLEVQSI
ncbi:MAG: stage V sporulation protein AD [Lachnospiraceae bacterium]|nr:stage V sporulation protein AD [Lachnospiraceae bacterium]